MIQIVKLADKYTGLRCGLLTIGKRLGPKGGGLHYNAICDCGNEKEVNVYYAIKSDTISCGCAIGEEYPPCYEIPEELKNIKNKKMAKGKLLVFENGEVFRVKGKLLYRCSKATQSRGGKYHSVSYSVNGVQKHVYVHRLVAEGFVPNPEGKPQVNHKDGDGHNNSADNLEWVTASENTRHAYRTGAIDFEKYASPCLVCSKLTNSPYLVCKSCYPTIERVRARRDKIAELHEKYKNVDVSNLTERELRVLAATKNGQTQRRIATVNKISIPKVRQIQKELLAKNKEEEQ